MRSVKEIRLLDKKQLAASYRIYSLIVKTVYILNIWTDIPEQSVANSAGVLLG